MRKRSYWLASIFPMKHGEVKVKGNREGFKRLEMVRECVKVSFGDMKSKQRSVAGLTGSMDASLKSVVIE